MCATWSSVVASATHLKSGTPYAALCQALAGALERVPDARLAAIVGQGAHDIATLMPIVGARLERLDVSLDPPELDAPRQRGARVREALLGVLER